MQREMSFLIDTNVVIAAEPFAGNLETLHSTVGQFLRTANEHGHKVYVHPATLDDLRETRDAAHRVQNIAAYGKYAALTEVAVPEAVRRVFPEVPSPNDQRDARILAALHGDAVRFLVTNDEKLRRRAIALGHEPRVLRPGEAAAQLAAWHPSAPPPPPAVEELKTYQLDATQRIFDTLREDYAPNFDGWIAKVKQESASRRAWVVRAPDGTYEAIALVKMCDAHPTVPGRNAIKLSTFKVGEQAAGRRLGELLLKAALRWAAAEPGAPREIFVEIKDKQDRLVEFLADFGFERASDKAEDEGAYLKALEPRRPATLGGLAHHVAHGPPAIRAGQPIFVIPITPQWYEDLFPDATYLGPSRAVLPGTFTTPKAHGNAIRKAYLCHSPTKNIPEGSTLLFYRSQGGVPGDGGVVAVGVAERSLRSRDPVETIEMSFKRTVYSADEVAQLHKDARAVLTILFRHDRFVEPPWTVHELVSRRVVTTWPQSIVRVKNKEGIAWVEEALSASR